MDVQWVGGAFRATDAAKNTVRIGTEQWQDTDDAPSPYDVLSSEKSKSGKDPDETVSGVVKQLRVPFSSVVIRELSRNDRWRFYEYQNERTIPDGEYFIRLCTNPRVFLRFDGAARFRRRGSDRLVMAFDDATPVSVLFRNQQLETDNRIRVRPRTEDLATVMPLLSTANVRTTPDRTWPASRERPPKLELGESLSIPRELAEEHPDTGITVRLPDRLSYLVTGASLIHYLGATVELGASAPAVCGPDWNYELPTLPEFQTAANGLLRRIFFLDCLARSAGPYGKRLERANLLSELGLDADALYDRSLAERVRRYLSVPFEQVGGQFPDWHLAMYVEPTFDHVTALPHLLERLPAVYLPESDELSKPEWIQLSLDEGRETDPLTRVRREISNVDLVKPNLRPAQYHGWLADDVPIDVFKTFPEAYDHRDQYVDDGPLSVVAVLNNAEMREEHDAAVRRYRSRAQELNLNVTVRENVRTDQLARVFESRTDLVHFIGHRDERGLECADGFLSLSSIDQSNAQSFFLNACGSYHEGVELIRKGSVAGAVTFEAVTDKQAAEVGTTFARLLMNGYCIQRALDKARRQVMTPKDYAVVGDGTHVLTGKSENPLPWDIALVESAGGYQLRYGQRNPRLIGAESTDTVQCADENACLATTERTYDISEDELGETLDLIENPLMFKGELYWPDQFEEISTP